MQIQIYRFPQLISINGGPLQEYTYFSFLETHIKLGKYGDASIYDSGIIQLPDEYEIYIDDRLRWKRKKRVPKKTIYPIIERKTGTENKK